MPSYCRADTCTPASLSLDMPQAQRTLQAPLSKVYLSSYTLEEVRYLMGDKPVWKVFFLLLLLLLRS